jgi:hypothetical protein
MLCLILLQDLNDTNQVVSPWDSSTDSDLARDRPDTVLIRDVCIVGRRHAGTAISTSWWRKKMVIFSYLFGSS